MPTQTPMGANAPIAENIIFCMMKQLSADLDLCNKIITTNINKNLESTDTLYIISRQQHFYGCKYTFAPLVDLVKELKQTPKIYMMVCLAMAINIELDKRREIFTKPHRRQTQYKNNNLEHKISIIYSEISLLKNNGFSWQRIAKEIKIRHRRLFEKYKVTPSYLRRVYFKLANQKAGA